MSGLTIHNSRLAEGWVSIAAEGEVDLATVGILEGAIDKVFADDDANLVVDLNATSFMDSTGLKVLVKGHGKYEEAGRAFVVATKGGPVSRLMDLSGIAAAIRVVEVPTDVLER